MNYEYFAFISYSSKDAEWGKRLQKKLEHYRLPLSLCKDHGWERTPMRPVFFAQIDIQPGGLSEEFQERLRTSRNFIVICSPNSAQSEWVSKEIEFFHSMDRMEQIQCFIVDGQPNSDNPDTECLNPIVNTLGLSKIHGANIHEKIYRWPFLNKEYAFVQLISRLLNIEFDYIWKRHKKRLICKYIMWGVGFVIILIVMVVLFMQKMSI